MFGISKRHSTMVRGRDVSIWFEYIYIVPLHALANGDKSSCGRVYPNEVPTYVVEQTCLTMVVIRGQRSCRPVTM